MTPTPHDALVKATFSQADNMAGELRAVLPSSLVARIDFATLQQEPGSFVDEALKERFTDILYSARIAGRPSFVYVLFEHQSGADARMAFRLLRYMVRIWEGFLKDRPEATALPAIVPVVLHHDEGVWKPATRFEALLDLAPEDLEHFGPFVPRFGFLLDDLSAVSDEALRDRAMSAFSRLTLTALKHSRSIEDMAAFLLRTTPLIRELMRSGGGAAALQLLFRYLVQTKPPTDTDALHRVVADLGPEVKETIMTMEEWLIQKGEQRGEQKGRVEGARQFLAKLLTLKFGALVEPALARIQAADEATLGRWAERVLSARSLEEVWE